MRALSKVDASSNTLTSGLYLVLWYIVYEQALYRGTSLMRKRPLKRSTTEQGRMQALSKVDATSNMV
jgi:hypothetical protein